MEEFYQAGVDISARGHLSTGELFWWIFEEALRRAEVKPSEAVHVGDLPGEDVAGAKRAGIRPLLIDRRRRMMEVDPPPGVERVGSLDDLIGMI